MVLRGSGPELVVVVSVDKMVVSPLGAKKQLSNRIALQVRRPKVGRSPGGTWLAEAFEFSCARLSPAWLGRAGSRACSGSTSLAAATVISSVMTGSGQHLPKW